MKRNRTYFLYRKSGCYQDPSSLELYVDTTGAVSRQRLLLSVPFPFDGSSGTVVVHPADSDLVYMRVNGDSLWVSSDGGETFEDRADSLTVGSDNHIYVSPYETSKVFVNENDRLDPWLTFLTMSTNQGITWVGLAPGDFRK